MFLGCRQHLSPPLSLVIFAVICFDYVRAGLGTVFAQPPAPPPHLCACYSRHMCAFFLFLFSGGDQQWTARTTK